MRKAVKAIVVGQVQGVGYRYTVQRIASKFDIVGFVRNLGDGTVEIQAEGEEMELKKFLEAINVKGGWINVEKIDSIWKQPEGKFSGFSVLPTV